MASFDLLKFKSDLKREFDSFRQEANAKNVTAVLKRGRTLLEILIIGLYEGTGNRDAIPSKLEEIIQTIRKENIISGSEGRLLNAKIVYVQTVCNIASHYQPDEHILLGDEVDLIEQHLHCILEFVRKQVSN